MSLKNIVATCGVKSMLSTAVVSNLAVCLLRPSLAAQEHLSFQNLCFRLAEGFLLTTKGKRQHLFHLPSI